MRGVRWVAGAVVAVLSVGALAAVPRTETAGVGTERWRNPAEGESLPGSPASADNSDAPLDLSPSSSNGGEALLNSDALYPWRAPTTHFGGTWQYVDGEFLYQDYIHDDFGADTGNRRTPQLGVPSTSQTAGNYRYPTNEDRYANNAADIDQFRAATADDRVYFLIRLNTLREPDTTVATLAIDLDASDSTGGGAWPFAAGITTPGSDLFLTLWGTDGAVSTPDGDPVPLRLLGGEIQVDTAANTFEVSLPRDLVPGQSWRLYLAAGLWDGQASEWMDVPPDPPTHDRPGYGREDVDARAFNVAFRPQEHRRPAGLLVGPRGGLDQGSGGFFDDEQAAALTAGDISEFAVDLDLNALDGNATDLYVPEPGRFHGMVMDQSFTIPPLHEGMTFENPVDGRTPGAMYGSGYHFFGPRQPFGLYLPTTYDGSTPLPTIMALHGRGGVHRGYQSSPGFLEDMAEAEPSIIVSPVGRGPWNMYTDYGEKDVLEVLDWVIERFPVDETRLYLGGYSMGGYGTLRLGGLYPHRFAAAVDWTGFSGDFAGHSLVGSAWRQYTGDAAGLSQHWETVTDRTMPPYQNGNPVEFLENLLHVPLMKLAGAADQLMPITSQAAVPMRLDELGYEHRFHLYAYEHLAFAIVDEWSDARAWLAQWQLDEAPRRVAYKFAEAMGNPELGIAHGDAYWVSDMRVRAINDPAITAYGMVDATSTAIPGRETQPRRIREPRTGPPPYLALGTTRDAGEELPVGNDLQLRLDNLATLRIALQQAAIDPSRTVTLNIDTDGPTTIYLDGWFTQRPKLIQQDSNSPVAFSHHRPTGVITLEIGEAGSYTLGLSRPGAATPK